MTEVEAFATLASSYATWCDDSSYTKGLCATSARERELASQSTLNVEAKIVSRDVRRDGAGESDAAPQPMTNGGHSNC